MFSSYILWSSSLVSWFIALAKLSRENKWPRALRTEGSQLISAHTAKNLVKSVWRSEFIPAVHFTVRRINIHFICWTCVASITHWLTFRQFSSEWGANAPPFGLFSLLLPTFCHFCYYYRYCYYSRCMFVYFLNSSLKKSFYLCSSVNESEDLPPTDAAVFQRSLHYHSILISVFLWIYSSDTNLLHLLPVEPDFYCSLVAWLMCFLILH